MFDLFSNYEDTAGICASLLDVFAASLTGTPICLCTKYGLTRDSTALFRFY